MREGFQLETRRIHTLKDWKCQFTRLHKFIIDWRLLVGSKPSRSNHEDVCGDRGTGWKASRSRELTRERHAWFRNYRNATKVARSKDVTKWTTAEQNLQAAWEVWMTTKGGWHTDWLGSWSCSHEKPECLPPCPFRRALLCIDVLCKHDSFRSIEQMHSIYSCISVAISNSAINISKLSFGMSSKGREKSERQASFDYFAWGGAGRASTRFRTEKWCLYFSPHFSLLSAPIELFLLSLYLSLLHLWCNQSTRKGKIEREKKGTFRGDQRMNGSHHRATFTRLCASSQRGNPSNEKGEEEGGWRIKKGEWRGNDRDRMRGRNDCGGWIGGRRKEWRSGQAKKTSGYLPFTFCLNNPAPSILFRNVRNIDKFLQFR